MGIGVIALTRYVAPMSLSSLRLLTVTERMEVGIFCWTQRFLHGLKQLGFLSQPNLFLIMMAYYLAVIYYVTITMIFNAIMAPWWKRKRFSPAHTKISTCNISTGEKLNSTPWLNNLAHRDVGHLKKKLFKIKEFDLFLEKWFMNFAS